MKFVLETLGRRSQIFRTIIATLVANLWPGSDSLEGADMSVVRGAFELLLLTLVRA
jgi:hypothetical protein